MSRKKYFQPPPYEWILLASATENRTRSIVIACVHDFAFAFAASLESLLDGSRTRCNLSHVQWQAQYLDESCCREAADAGVPRLGSR